MMKLQMAGIADLNNLGFGELRITNVLRCEEVFHKLEAWSPCDWATAMAGKCGEACNIVKKLRRLDDADATSVNNTPAGRAYFTGELATELAALVIYADLLAARMGIDLGEAVAQKFNEVSERRGSGLRLPVKRLEVNRE